ncbi:MAG: adenosylcobinamide-GDP ribazoletransferase [Lachnospiraceae bacterium]|nr:adenosylcobinamide-GDP ribazoletransferase [Lachnospiraceae bacterium]
MKVLKALVIAFSLYSAIPMPQFTWEEEDMRYVLCFFPWIGAVIGALLYGWGMISHNWEIGTLCYSCIGAAIPLMVTGGFHVDGFMDTMDAFHSYQQRERKLEILKDSHIGAFSVIMLGLYALIYIGAFSEIEDIRALVVVGAGFFLARVLSGLAVVMFPTAKKEGMLFLFADSSQKKIVIMALLLQGIVCMAFMLYQSCIYGVFVGETAIVVFVYYYFRTKKELGGITGDTAGYFVVLCEGCMMVAVAVLQVLGI